MNNILEKLKTTRILAIVGIASLILGILLPYVSYDIFGYNFSISLWHYWEGKIMFIIILANLLFIFKDIVARYVPQLFNSALGKTIYNCQNPKFSLIPTGICVLFAIYLTSILDVKSFKYYSIGFYLMWLGTICLVAYAFLHKADYTVSSSNSNNVTTNYDNIVVNDLNSNDVNPVSTNEAPINNPVNMNGNVNEAPTNDPINMNENANETPINDPINMDGNANEAPTTSNDNVNNNQL